MNHPTCIKALGKLDSTVINQDSLAIEGWAASEESGRLTGLDVTVGGRTCRVIEQVLRIPSADVKAAWPGMDESGCCRFRLRVALPEGLASKVSDLSISVEPSFERGSGKPLEHTLTNTIEAQSSSLIAEGDAAQREGSQTLAKEKYRQALAIHPCCIEAHNKVERLGGVGTYTHNFRVIAQIDPRDDIFRFFENHERARNPIREYLSDGWRTLSELLLLLDKLNISLSNCGSFLEFASGFGRFTRHLVTAVDSSRLCVSDVVDGSVDFLRETFGVAGFYSSLDPLKIKVERKFEIIFVLSLFSHLPEESWQPWITALMSMLEPGGVLIFTTHGDRASSDMGYMIPDSGYRFVPSSESQTLDGACYGTTFASEQYVRTVLGQAAAGCRVDFFPAKFWAQDAFVVFSSQAR